MSDIDKSELDMLVSSFHRTHCHSNAAWFKGQKEPFPCDCDVSKLQALITQQCNDLLFDFDEIENKPWRVFRQLAKIMPEYADTYGRYEQFYAHGGGNEVMKLIEKFEVAQAKETEKE